MSLRGWLLFTAVGIIWGLPYLFIKVVVEGGVSAPVLVFARTAVGALILLPLALRGGWPWWLRRHWRPVLAFAAIEIILPWFLLSDAEHELTSGTTGLLVAAVPIITVVVGRLTHDDDRLTALRWVGLAIGFAGVAVLAAPELRGGDPWSIAEVLLVAICYATAPLILTRQLKEVPGLPLTAVCLAIGAVVWALPAAFSWPDEVPGGDVLGALAGLATICTALAMVLFFALIREVGAARAVVITYVNPAVAIVAGAIVLDEPLTAAILVSFALILAGSFLATARRRRPVAEATTGGAPAAPADDPGAVPVPASREPRTSSGQPS